MKTLCSSSASKLRKSRDLLSVTGAPWPQGLHCSERRACYSQDSRLSQGFTESIQCAQNPPCQSLPAVNSVFCPFQLFSSANTFVTAWCQGLWQPRGCQGHCRMVPVKHRRQKTLTVSRPSRFSNKIVHGTAGHMGALAMRGL